MNNVVQELSDEIARHPETTAYVPLADALRQRGQLDAARLIALRGLERHPYVADAHDVLARVYADAGDTERARDEWEMALQLDAGHVSSRKGLGFLAYRIGDVRRAAEWLGSALEHAPDDEGLRAAYQRVCLSVGAPVRPLMRWGRSDEVTEPFGHAVVREGLEAGDGDRAAATGRSSGPAEGAALRATLLLDRDGLLVGVHGTPAPRDDEAIAAHSATLFTEATRASHHLGLGECVSLLVEGERVVCGVGVVSADRLALVISRGLAPVGLVRSHLERSIRLAQRREGEVS